MPDATAERSVAGEMMHRPEHDAKPLSNIPKHRYFLLSAAVLAAAVDGAVAVAAGNDMPRFSGAIPERPTS